MLATSASPPASSSHALTFLPLMEDDAVAPDLILFSNLIQLASAAAPRPRSREQSRAEQHPPASMALLNTNVRANSDGKKEQQFYLWFDPAADYLVLGFD